MSAQGAPPPYQGQSQYGYAPAPPPKRSSPWKWIALGCGGLLLLSCVGTVALLALGIVGSRSTTSASVAAINTPVTTDNWQMTVRTVEKAKTLNFGYGNQTALGTFMVVEVAMQNRGDRNFGVNTSDFRVRTTSGATVNTTDQFGASTFRRDRGAATLGGQVPPGVSATYFLVFDVDPNATGLELEFNQQNKPRVKLD